MATNLPVFEMIDPKEAPAKSIKTVSDDTLKQRAAYDGFVKSLTQGKVGVIKVPEAEQGEEKNPRSVQMMVQRAAARVGIEIEAWNNTDNVYVQLKSKTAAKSNGTEAAKV